MFRIVLGLLLALMTSVVSVPAHAASDVVRQLDVTYDVRADGTIGVAYELDWDFGQTGRRGIEFAFVTVEPWDLDPRLEARYTVSNLSVSSPTGAPADFEEREHRDPSGRTELQLRIGDEDRPLDSERETYRIEFDMTGGLRTFDAPELFLDVTGEDYPTIEAFTVTVQASGEIPRARCLVGARECSAEVSGDRAVLSGGDVSRGTTISAVAELPASQRGAEPDLHPRDTSSTFLLGQEVTQTVRTDGVVEVDARWVHHVGEHRQLVVRQPLRQRVSPFWEHEFDVTDPVITDASGRELPVEVTRFDGFLVGQPTLRFTVDVPEDLGDEVELHGRWQVEGAVDSDGDVATFGWSLESMTRGSLPTTERHVWDFPADVGEARWSRDDDRLPALIVEGNSLEVSWEGAVLPGRPWLAAELPASTVGNASADRHFSPDVMGAFGSPVMVPILLGGFLFFVIAGYVAGRFRPGSRDERYADAPPGEFGREVTTAPLRGEVPVRLEPPSAAPAVAGYALLRRFHPRQVAATLTQMAVAGSIQLGSKPLTVVPRDASRVRPGLEAELFALATTGGAMGSHRLRRFNRAVERDYKKALKDPTLFRQDGTARGRILPIAAWVAVVGLAAYAWVGDWQFLLRMLLAFSILVFGIGFLNGFRARKRRLGPAGSALRVQAEGFRTYIRTAEARQLDFEADRDIFSEFLPWAVLFGETKRWTKVCEQLAAEGRIRQPHTGFVVGATSMASVAAGLGSMDSGLSRASTSAGGSGSSSGFSGGGGGGGGGSSAGSW